MTKNVLTPFTLIFLLTLHLNASAQFAGGDGTADDPWQIESSSQLLNIDDHLDGHFIQTGHIDMGGVSFTAIGSPSEPFTGYYDGDHYEIRNMSISMPEMNEQALFRAAEEAVFRNMIFTDASVEGSRRVGILVGVAEGIILENISVSGEVISHGSTGMNWSEAGGMAGSIRGGIVRHCIADVVVTGHRTVGGLIGSFTNSEIYQSASYGQISGQGSNSGGLIGLMGGTGVITDSYSHANVEGDNTVGGLIGNFSAQGGRIQNCLSTGRVTGTGDDVGGLLGSVFSASRMHISHCFWNASASDITVSAGGAGVKGLSMTELMQRETYDGFNFHSLWQIDDGNSYPSFQDLSEYEIPEPASIDDLQGDGTADEPWLISTASELLAMADDVHGHYRLTADIDLNSSVIWNHGRGWTPMGGTDEEERFTGVLDGDGHRITGMVINHPAQSQTGIIRYAEDAVIKNLILEEHYVIGSDYTGGIIGEGESVVMENIQLSGHIRSASAQWANVGGFAGRVRNSTFRNTKATISVAGHHTVGGLVGDFIDSEMYQSASYGQISGIGINIGGMIGGSRGWISIITDSYSHADVEGDRIVGGLIGNFQSGRIQNCLSTGRVTGIRDDVGGLIGSIFSASRMHISHCFWNETTSGQSESAGGEGVKGLSTSELMQRETYDGFNFHSLWQIEDGSSYPYFQDLAEYEIPEPASIDDLRGSGSSDSPWLISSPSELLAMAENIHGHYRLTADIDLKSSVIWNHGRGWTPLGGTNEGERFTGVLDGDDHRITGMVINYPLQSQTGMIRYAEDAVITNLILENHYVIGSDYTGGIIGDGESVVMENIQLSGYIRSASDQWSNVGGFAGRVENSTIRQALARVSVNGHHTAGGMVGDFIDSEMYQSASYGQISGIGINIGGIIGGFRGTKGVITDSYSHADVEGDRNVGGLIGNFGRGDIKNTYSIGKVTGSGDDVGGLIGGLFSASPENSYWNTETSGQMQSAGGDGVMGRTTDEMTWPYAGNTYESWDFDGIWKEDSDGSVNNGYPWLMDKLFVRTDVRVPSQPVMVRLHQNYPNPFNPATTITYTLTESGPVHLAVYDILGRKVVTLINEHRAAGEHTVSFTAEHLSSGTYLYRLQADGAVLTRKMMIVK